MNTPPDTMNRLVVAVRRAAALALVATLAACADDASPVRLTEPSTASFGKNVTGTNQRLLFTSMRNGSQQLFSINPDGTGLTQLTFDTAGDAYGVWSPDGKRIAFMSARDNPLGEIYTMNPDGTGVVRITTSAGSSREPSWSKDGKQIVFASNRTAVNPSIYNANDYEIFVMNADGSGVKRITNNSFMDGSPVWSPDGKQIAFASNRDNFQGSDIYVMNVDGSLLTRLTQVDQGVQATLPAWEPHRRNVAFQANGSLFTVDPATHLQTQLTHGSATAWDMDPSYSADGTQIAFASSRVDGFELYTMNADGSQQVRITNNYWIDFFVRWSR